jgi:hypothetical protein
MKADHFYHGGGWKYYSFLPFYDFRLCNAVTDAECHICPLACYNHPLVESGEPHTFIKLCTKDVIRNRIMTAHDVLTPGSKGCGATNDSDRMVLEMVI